MQFHSEIQLSLQSPLNSSRTGSQVKSLISRYQQKNHANQKLLFSRSLDPRVRPLLVPSGVCCYDGSLNSNWGLTSRLIDKLKLKSRMFKELNVF
jgi:hypothetical protein